MNKFTLLKRLSLATLLVLISSLSKAQSCSNCAGAIMNAASINNTSGAKNYCYDVSMDVAGISTSGTGTANIFIKPGVKIRIPSGNINLQSSNNNITLCDGAVLNVAFGSLILGTNNTINMEPNTKMFVYGTLSSFTNSRIYVTGNTAIESCASTYLNDNATISFINPGNRGRFYFVSRGSYSYVSGQNTFTSSSYGSRMNWIAFDKVVAGTPVNSGGTANADICNVGACVVPYTSPLWSVITHTGLNDPCGQIITAPFPTPVIGLAKRVSSVPALQGDGSYNITYSFIVKNGSVAPTAEDLKNLQVTDDLAATFPAPATATVTSLTTTGTLTKNAAYNGTTNKNLLTPASSTLAIGASATITLTINVKLNGSQGTFKNTASATGTGVTSLDSDTDVSNDGTDATPTGSTTTDVTLTGIIGIAKSGPTAVLYPKVDGTYDITYVFTVKNFGASALSNVQVTDDLTATFPAPAVVSVTSLTKTGTVIVNGTYNGSTNKNLLTAASSTLAVGATATITLTINVDLKGQVGTYKNTATATATDPYNNTTTDVSNNGTDPDPSGNVTTDVVLTQKGVIGIAKSGPTAVLYPKGDGTYDVTYVFTVKNFGAVALNNVQVTDDLTATFPAPAVVTVTSLTKTGTVTVNGSYNGNSNKNLLTAASSTLAVGATATITLTVNVDLKGQVGTYKNTATATGVDPNSNTTTDVSNNGTDPDPSGNVTTDVVLTQKGVIGIAKSGPTAVLYPKANGTYDVTYVFTVKNFGAVPLNNVQITDDLTATFPAPAVVSVTSLIKTGTVTVNASYNGSSNKNLLTAASSTLAVGATATITLTVNVDLKGQIGTYKNTATATATDPNSNTTTDVSNNGTDPNPSGNVTTDVVLTQKGVIGIAKSGPLTAIYPKGNGTYDVTYVFTVKNFGVVALNNVQVTDDLTATFPAPAVVTVTSLAKTGTITVNGAYNGTTNKNLLTAASSTLAVGASATITLAVNVDLKGQIGTYKNTSTATGIDPNSNTTTDISNNGTDPNPTGSNTTDVLLTRKGAITLLKSVASKIILPLPDKTYDVTYTFKIINDDKVLLKDINLYDTLNKTFPAPAVITVKKPISAIVKGTGAVVVNPAYDGISAGKFGILDPALSTLASGDTAIIVMTVNVDLKGDVGTFNNSATTTAKDPTNNNVSGTSNAGIKTEVILTKKGIIDLIKTTSTPLIYDKADGTYDVKYTFTIINKEKVEIKNLNLYDTLIKSFPAPAIVAAKVPTVIKGNIVANPLYDGKSDYKLLDSTKSSLAIGDTAIISLDVNVDLKGAIGIFTNSATSTGVDLSGTIIKDTSKVKVSLTQKGELDIKKSVSSSKILPKPDGTYDITYTLTVANTGLVDINSLNVYDTLSKTFPAPAVVVKKSLVKTSGPATVVINPLYDGIADYALTTAASSSLKPGESITLTLVINVDLKGTIGTYRNTATTTGTDINGNPVIDHSNDGTSTDVILTRNGVLDITKAVSANKILPRPDGTYDITYTLTVANTGLVDITNINVYDTLSKTFPSPAVVVKKSLVKTSGPATIVINPLYDGVTNYALTNPAASSLKPGESTTFTLVVNVDLKGGIGTFRNTATTTGTDVNGNPVIDHSNNGTSTDVILTRDGILDIKKSVSSSKILPKADGTYDITYTLTIANTGVVDISNLNVYDTLSKTFPAPVVVVKKSLVKTSGPATITINPLYDGVTDYALTNPAASSLKPGESATLTLVINVDLKGAIGTYRNTATTTGTDVNGNPVIDHSNDGTSTDVILTRNGILDITKAVSANKILPKADGTYDITYTLTVANTGVVDISNLNVYDTLSKTFPLPAVVIKKSLVKTSGPATVVINPLYDGVTDYALTNPAASSLKPGESTTLTLVINVDLKGGIGTYKNTATTTGTDINGNDVIDHSNNGTSTDVTLSRDGILDVTKTVSSSKILPKADGTFDITYTFTVSNPGLVAITNLNVFDTLSKTFPLPIGVVKKSLVKTAGATTVVVNPLFDGLTNFSLLDSTKSSLQPGASATLTLLINVDLKGGVGTFRNTATATGTDVNGNPVIDHSNDGTSTDVTLSRDGIIGVSKTGPKGLIKPNAKGTFDITYTFTVKNLGVVDLSKVQVNDTLSKTFPAPAVVTVLHPLKITGVTTLKLNPNYNGTTDVGMLDSTASNLAVGTTATITMTINVDLKTGRDGVFKNSAKATAVDVNGTHVSDISNDGVNPNNDPKDTTTTDVHLLKDPLIGIAKAAAAPVLKDGKDTYEISYTFTVKNYGSVNLNNIQVTDDLKKTFPYPHTFKVVSLTASGGITANAAYNGSTNINLLDPLNSNLPRGAAAATITLVIEAKLGYKSTIYYNTAIATAIGENNTGNTSDISTNGQTPDPNGNDTPNDVGEDVPTPVEIVITDIFIPDGVSPNDDTKNDYFEIKGIENYPDNTLLIFNRWGAQVYSTTGYKNTWDGTSDNSLNVGGNKLPDGVYYYILNLGNGSKPHTGYIYLKR